MISSNTEEINNLQNQIKHINITNDGTNDNEIEVSEKINNNSYHSYSENNNSPFFTSNIIKGK